MSEPDKQYRLRARIWLESDGESWLGPGRVRLLRAVDREGSISAAARSVKMSYHKAWSLVESMNKASRLLLVQRSVGGKGGGGARLTPWGRRVVDIFDQSEQTVQNLVLDLQVKMRNELQNEINTKGKQ